MTADIILGDDDVTLVGSWTKIHTLDIMLDAPSRRMNDEGYRRALVHDDGDCLTINYASDYPNGVKINGHTSVDHVYVLKTAGFAHEVITPRLLLGKPPEPRKVGPSQPKGSTSPPDVRSIPIREGTREAWAADQAKAAARDLQTNPGMAAMPGDIIRNSSVMDVGATILALQEQVAALQARIDALEG